MIINNNRGNVTNKIVWKNYFFYDQFSTYSYMKSAFSQYFFSFIPAIVLNTAGSQKVLMNYYPNVLSTQILSIPVAFIYFLKLLSVYHLLVLYEKLYDHLVSFQSENVLFYLKLLFC